MQNFPEKRKPELKFSFTKDGKLISRLHSECFSDKEWDIDSLEQMLMQKNYFALVGKIHIEVGFCLFRKISADEGEIVSIGVKTTERQKGFGKKILEQAVTKLSNIGANKIFLFIKSILFFKIYFIISSLIL